MEPRMTYSKPNYPLLKIPLKIGQELSLLMNQFGPLELEKLPVQKLLKKLMHSLDLGLLRIAVKKLLLMSEFNTVDQ